MIEVVLLFVVLELAIIGYCLSRQLEQQHRQMMELIDALAEMVGEAIDLIKREH